MSESAARGKSIVITIAVILGLPATVRLITAIASPAPLAVGDVVRSLIAIGLSLLLWRGFSWARSVTAFCLALGAVLLAIFALRLLSVTPWGMLLFVLPPLYAWSSWLLWESPQVLAYIDYCSGKRKIGSQGV